MNSLQIQAIEKKVVSQDANSLQIQEVQKGDNIEFANGFNRSKKKVVSLNVNFLMINVEIQ